MLNSRHYEKGLSIPKVVLGLAFLVLMVSCIQKGRHVEGEKLAKIHCASCHLYPEPELLPRRVWGEKIMPNMGLKMGMSHGPLYSYGDKETLKNLTPTLSQEDWDRIVHFYLNKSENSVTYSSVPVQYPSTLFEPHLFSIDSLSVISMTLFDEKKNALLLGDALTSELLTLNLKGDILETKKLESPLVKTEVKDTVEYLLTIGDINPSDKAEGSLKIGESAIEDLTRPVDFLIRDMDLDGYDDVFVCSYGHNVGDFSLFKNLGRGVYKKQVIHPLSGSIKVELTDMDNDQEDEIVVLFAQEHELLMIWDYKNNTFNGQKVLQFQPAFGSVDFQLRDINNDGLKDIIIGNGDNSDLSTVLKNFHGVRVFLNKGDQEFSESYFLPIHGVSKVVAEDFDLDGDIDIMAISNFGNFSDPQFRSVQLLMNEGHSTFTSKYIENLPNFRWQTIDVSDYDKDGDLDIFLGAFNLNIGPEESYLSEGENISWVKLENTMY
ncbi:FG-GAP repeat domain-containing protein [Ulvibacterium sp.]|uniref:FG-GAP repeat domain-containing protein n=1 Tax=Ulvibacterium sp. TaxID=2665914 RepID=UPI003BA9DFFC